MFVGLDSSGKTTIMYQLKHGEVVTTSPTTWFNVESIEHGNVNFIAWDVGGSEKMRPLLSTYYPSTEAVVFVVDTHGHEFYLEVVEMLEETTANDELRDVPVLILANTQDLSNVMTRE